MANIRVKSRLDRIASELALIRSQVMSYSGVDAKDARQIDRDATAIAEEASRIAGEARKAMGDRSAAGLVKRVRKALGFTYP